MELLLNSLRSIVRDNLSLAVHGLEVTVNRIDTEWHNTTVPKITQSSCAVAIGGQGPRYPAAPRELRARRAGRVDDELKRLSPRYGDFGRGHELKGHAIV